MHDFDLDEWDFATDENDNWSLAACKARSKREVPTDDPAKLETLKRDKESIKTEILDALVDIDSKGLGSGSLPDDAVRTAL